MVLVTGATGLLGSHVVCRLIADGFSVKAMYRSENRRERVNRLLLFYFPEKAEEYAGKITWCKGDVLDLTELRDAMNGCSRIVHCAALVSFHRRDFHALFEVNRTGTANVVNLALDLGISKLIHVSSTAAIGSDAKVEDGIKRETNRWNANEEASGYSLSKFSAEKEVWRGTEEGLNAAIVNPSLMFGPGDWDESSLKILRTLENGLKFYTGGGNAFVDVRDVAEIIARLLQSDVTAERFLVAGHNMSFKAFFDEVCRQMNCKAPSVKASSFMTALAWRASGFVSRMTGKRATITKESARSAHRTTVYSPEKLIGQFPDFKFRSISDTIENTIKGRMRN